MCLPLKTHTFIHTLFTAEVSLNTVKNNTFLKKQKLLLCQSNRRDLNILLPHCRHHNGTKSALMPEPNRLVTLSSLGAHYFITCTKSNIFLMHVCLGGVHTACLQDTRLCFATESTRRQGKEKALPTDVRSGKNVAWSMCLRDFYWMTVSCSSHSNSYCIGYCISNDREQICSLCHCLDKKLHSYLLLKLHEGIQLIMIERTHTFIRELSLMCMPSALGL